MSWSEFVRGCALGQLTQPFLVRELVGETHVWRFYAAASGALVQLVSHKYEPRSWRDVGRALNELERGLSVLKAAVPPVTVYFSIDAVPSA